LKNVYGIESYSAVQDDLHKELARLRTAVKDPEQDAPESLALPMKPKK
jgi:hypothetical protein